MSYEFKHRMTPTLVLALGQADVEISTHPEMVTRVEVSGPEADDILVDQRTNTVTIRGRRRHGWLGRDLHVKVVVPEKTTVVGKLGSGRLETHGMVKTVRVHIGRGDVSIATASDSVVLKSGAGRLSVGESGGSAVLATGAGAIHVGRIAKSASLMSGLGDIDLDVASGDLAVKTGAGNVVVRRAEGGKLSVRTHTGTTRIGVPVGTPVWTDITTGNGEVTSTLASVGEPARGQKHVEVRIRSSHGDVLLEPAP